ncbi:MAG TPA: enoyl-CoA hydratase-related protein [Caulobacteraceae bacterium]
MASSNSPPALTHFRIEIGGAGVAHLIFDMSGASMNVLSDAVIEDFGRFTDWFLSSEARALVIRSAKPVFCTGGDLSELSAAYDRISTLPILARFEAAKAHFASMGRHLRRLETSGKPVAVAIGGLALGGGCEIALTGHYRVLAQARPAMLGLPEVVVGLLPGAGGTQRLPRLIGLEKSLPLLLDGARLSSSQALMAGLVDELVAPGEEVAAAEAWALAAAAARQPWDRPGFVLPDADSWKATLRAARAKMLARTQGNDPAPIALFDCLEAGLDCEMDAALEIEGAAFAKLIQRPEPRNMIRALFMGAQEHARRSKAGALSAEISKTGEYIADGLAGAVRRELEAGVMSEALDSALGRLGFPHRVSSMIGRASESLARTESADPCPVSGGAFWFEAAGAADAGRIARRLLDGASSAFAAPSVEVAGPERLIIDHVAVRDHGFPAWIGGPFAWLDQSRPGAPAFALSEMRE